METLKLILTIIFTFFSGYAVGALIMTLIASRNK